jgi:hypothetical protein
LGEQILHKTWFDSLFDLVELARLGIEAVKGQFHFQPPLVAQVEERLLSFLLHKLEAWCWCYAWWQSAFPEAFVALLSPDFGETPVVGASTSSSSSTRRPREPGLPGMAHHQWLRASCGHE